MLTDAPAPTWFSELRCDALLLKAWVQIWSQVEVLIGLNDNVAVEEVF
jgi:hypothetical protein